MKEDNLDEENNLNNNENENDSNIVNKESQFYKLFKDIFNNGSIPRKLLPGEKFPGETKILLFEMSYVKQVNKEYDDIIENLGKEYDKLLDVKDRQIEALRNICDMLKEELEKQYN